MKGKNSVAGVAVVGLLLALAGCVETSNGGHQPIEPQPGPQGWTRAFQRPAVLVADAIVVEGPEDLLEHLVLRQDPEHLTYVTKTTEQGLFQELTPKPGVTGIEIRGQVDALELVALGRLAVLQRPGEVPVTVRAAGQVYYALGDGSQETRQDTLELVGQRWK